jgi:hypothetical protein
MIDGGTERKREHAVRLSQAPQILAQAILDRLREPILVLDVTLRAKMPNRSFSRTSRLGPRGERANSFMNRGMASGTFPSPVFSWRRFVSATGQPLCQLLRDEAGRPGIVCPGCEVG